MEGSQKRVLAKKCALRALYQTDQEKRILKQIVQKYQESIYGVRVKQRRMQLPKKRATYSMARRFISIRIFLISIIVSMSCICSSPLFAQQRQRVVLYFNSFDANSAESSNAPKKDSLIANAVTERLDELDVDVQQITLPKTVNTDDDAFIARVLECSQTSGMGCFWISESMGGFNVHLIFYSSQNTWKMQRHVDSQELVILAESTALVVKSTY